MMIMQRSLRTVSAAQRPLLLALLLCLWLGPSLRAAAQAPAAQAPAAQPGGFFFHNGDRPILFLGDSITEQRMYTTYIEAYVLTRFPTWDVTFRNVGWSGDGAPLWMRGGQDAGLQRDVLPLKPASITIDFGMNDARGGDAAYPNFVAASTTLVQRLKAAGARVALLSPSPEERYEAGQPGGSAYNHMLAKYSQGLKQIAAQEHVVYVDQHTPFVQVIESGRTAGVLGKDADPRLIPDGVHPNWAGHLVMATAILKGLGAPALVSRVVLDAAKSRVVQAVNCRAELLPATAAEGAGPAAGGQEKALVFRRTDAALPMPVPADAALVLKVPGFTPLDDLSRYDLQVTHLTQPRYQLLIDDQKSGVFTREQLAAGVNLTMQPGPITDQVNRLFQAIQDKNNLYYNRWRNVQVYAVPAWITKDIEADRRAELAKEDAQIAAKEAEINQMRRPAPHVFKLIPEPPAQPTALNLSRPAEDTVRLSWDPSAGATGYQVERSTDGIHFEPAATLAAGMTTWIDRNASAASLFYRVAAVSAVSRSGFTPASTAWQGTGLQGAYFAGKDLSHLALTRTDPVIDFNWDTAAPAPSVSRDVFSVRWTGRVQPHTTETYTFAVTSDDGARLWVDNRLLIDQWQDQAPTESSGTIALTANKTYPIKLEYYQGGGGASVQLRWWSASEPRQIIPQVSLYPNGEGKS